MSEKIRDESQAKLLAIIAGAHAARVVHQKIKQRVLAAARNDGELLKMLMSCEDDPDFRKLVAICEPVIGMAVVEALRSAGYDLADDASFGPLLRGDAN